MLVLSVMTVYLSNFLAAISLYRKGFSNRLYKCQLSSGCQNSTVVVRLLGGSVIPVDAPHRILNETSELLIFYAIGQNGLGPKLLAAFTGGRIEEYVLSRSLTIDEWLFSSAVNKEAARIMAQFHLMRHPISKSPWNLRSMVEKCLTKFNQEKKLLQANSYLIPEILSSIEFNFEDELEFAETLLSKVESRIIFATNDPNRSNYLMRTDADESDLTPLQLMLVDYEFASYNFRAFDIGNYFCMKYYDLGSRQQLTGHGYPSEEYRTQFITHYIDQVNQSHNKPKDWDARGRDSIEHILLEADLGSFIIRIMDIAWTLSDVKVWVNLFRQQRLIDPRATVACFSMPDYYYERKKHFLKRHQHSTQVSK